MDLVNTTISTKNCGNLTITHRIHRDDVEQEEIKGHIYLATDKIGNKYFVKHFCNSSRVISTVNYAKVNHYGRSRDGSRDVFHEIQNKNCKYPFLLKFYDRIKHKDNKWLIITEYFEGENMQKFIRQQYSTNKQVVCEAMCQFGKILKEWHNNDFSHGDPHLANVMVSIDTNKVIEIKLVDYGMIHHPDFKYCQKIGCFFPDSKRRINEDFDNTSGKVGIGFLKEIKEIESFLNTNEDLSHSFMNGYDITIK